MAHHEHRSCIEACVRCAQECEHCAAACLNEVEVAALADCIRLDRDCAEICWTAAALISPEHCRYWRQAVPGRRATG